MLVFEPALPGGVLKTARKGVGTFRLDVHGVSAHAGIAPQDGASAITELARQILAMHALQAPERGTTINTGLIAGGSRSNVVAEHAHGRDRRARQRGRRAGAHRAGIRGPRRRTTRASVWPGTAGSSDRRSNGVRTCSGCSRWRRAAGASLGLDVREGATGGASDGNFTAALGVPTLDGLGAIGDGAHARHEHVEIASLPDRAALAAAILMAIDARG